MEYNEEEYEKTLKEYEDLKKRYQLLEQGIQKAYLDPETREPLKKILKKHAGIEIDDPAYEKNLKQEISKLEEKIAKLEEKGKEEKLKKKEEDLRKLLSDYGITEQEIPQLRDFISKTGLNPVTEAGWVEVLRNYQRSKIAVPTAVRPKAPLSKGALPEDYLKDPNEAFFKEHLKALKII